MAFSSKNNRITIKGYLTSNVEDYDDYAITFNVKVMRPTEQGKRPFYDVFTVYVCDKQNVGNCRNNLVKGSSVSVTGELRVWVDGSYKICANKVSPIW